MTIDLLTLAVIAIYMYPGSVLYLFRHSIMNIKSREGDSLILAYFSILVLSTLYWLFVAIVVLRANLSEPFIITIVSLGLPAILLSLKVFRYISMFFKKLRAGPKGEMLSVVTEEKKFCGQGRVHHFSRSNLVVTVQVLLLSSIFFLSSYYFESIDPTSPAGYDRNTHLARILWFMEKSNIMIKYPGTLFLNYRPVGFHMLLAVIFKIILFIFGIVCSPSPQAYIVNISTVISLFGVITHFLISFYPIAVFVVIYELSNKSKGLALLSSLASVSYIGYIVALEPLHNILGMYIVGFFFIMLRNLKDSRRFMELRSLIFLAILVVSAFLIHPFAFIYLVIVLFFLLVETTLSMWKEGLKKDKIIRIVRSFVSIILLSGVFALVMYPEFTFGLVLVFIRTYFNNSSYIEQLERYAISPLPNKDYPLWETFYLYVKTSLYGYLHHITVLSLLIALNGIFLYIWLGSLIIGEISFDRKTMSGWRYIIILLFASIIYIFLPVVPKIGISEVKGIYFFPLIFGGSLYINAISIGNIIKKVKNAILKKNLQGYKVCNILRKTGWSIFIVFFCIGNIFLIKTSDAIMLVEIKTIPHYKWRIYGYMYINMDEVYILAEYINKYIPSEYYIVYPNSGPRRMEQIILDCMIDHEILSVSDVRKNLYIPLFYVTYGLWVQGEYRIIRFRVSDSEYFELVTRFGIGGIIEDIYCKTNYTQIKLIFPNSFIIKISNYYTLIVLNYWKNTVKQESCF